MKGETIKHLKDNIGKQLCDLEVGEDLFNNTNHKGKIDTLDFNKINYFCLPKDITNSEKARHILETPVTDKGLVSRSIRNAYKSIYLSDGQMT